MIVRALHNPGHRPEHSVFALIDTRRGDDPWALLSGDTLFVNDVARPDLAIEKSEGARGIFQSLRDQILTLPDVCGVWPGHLGGSMCGGPGMDMVDVRTDEQFDDAHVPGSVHTAYHDITALPAGLDPAKPIAVTCGSGQRAAVAASLVALHGGERVLHVTPFGVPRWGRLGFELQTVAKGE